MLKRLEVQNYAIIDHIEVHFSGKMNIITGETGAGKSIVMGALSLILGDRADTSVMMNREKKCYVEGVFDVSKNIRKILKDNDLESDDELVVRREINASGKSRAFINDTPVQLDVLREITESLVDLHRQFDTLELGHSHFQREVLDALASNRELLGQYQQQYNRMTELHLRLKELHSKKEQYSKELDYNKFLFDELEQASFKENELEEIEGELKLLNNSEAIKTLLSKLQYELSESDTPIVQQLKQLANQASSFSEFHPLLGELSSRLSSLYIELQDIVADADRINDEVGYDPARIEAINERLSMGYRLQKKHGLSSTNELISLQQELSGKLKEVLNMDDVIASITAELAGFRESAEKLAMEISKNRKGHSASLEQQVNALLMQVGMPNARLRVDVRDSGLGPYGSDEVEFMFDANKSNRFEPIRKVASGGELSRLMLCIKSLVAASMDLSTMIFDEIDTGISGEAARQVGIIMKKLAAKRQVIAITHQPQIAGKADAHYFIFKEVRDDAVKTNIRQLDIEERITAIARMLGGEKPTAAALQNAREMVMK